LKRNKKIEIDFILEGLSDQVKLKVGQCSSAKEIWYKLHNIYYKESHSITETEHANQNKKYVEVEQVEGFSSCPTYLEEEYCEAGVMDFEIALINALSELNKERRENESLKEELIRIKEGSREFRQFVMNLNAQLEEAKIIEGTLKE
jgi:hypothetical protein